MSTSSFWLDDYNDIYSDFDSRHYQSRRISDDFLHEMRLDMRYQTEPADQLLFLVPQQKRDSKTEEIIKANLHKFFRGQFTFYQDKCSRKLRTNILMAAIGILVMMVDATIIFLGIKSLWTTVLSTVMEPASWFLLWTSVDYMLLDWNDLKREKQFYKILSNAEISFNAA